MSKSDLKWRFMQVAENYDTLADNIEKVAARHWLTYTFGKATK